MGRRFGISPWCVVGFFPFFHSASAIMALFADTPMSVVFFVFCLREETQCRSLPGEWCLARSMRRVPVKKVLIDIFSIVLHVYSILLKYDISENEYLACVVRRIRVFPFGEGRCAVIPSSCKQPFLLPSRRLRGEIDTSAVQ